MRGSPLAVLLTAVCLCCAARAASNPSSQQPADPTAAAAGLRLSFINTSRGAAAKVPVYATCTCLDRAGRFCRLDASGRLRPCSTADNVVVLNGQTWCDYGIPLPATRSLELDPEQPMISGRIYLSAGSPLFLRVDEATGGLVQPDPANPSDPNRSIRFDWIEFTLDGTGFHGNTTCVDQFGLPIALTVFGRAGQHGPVGLTESRSALFAAFRASVPPAFQELADPQDCRILAPAHGAFAAAGPEKDYLQGYIDRMWAKYRSEPLVLTPDQGSFTGTVDAKDRIVFTRAGSGGSYVIQGKPTSQEVFLCNGVLAQGSATEKVLGAQIAAMLNRHVLETPMAWRQAGAYYRKDPCNRYAWFWHQHGLGHQAYGFAYDDVNGQSTSLAAPDPLAISIAYRLD
jgi:hypothetical protein